MILAALKRASRATTNRQPIVSDQELQQSFSMAIELEAVEISRSTLYRTGTRYEQYAQRSCILGAGSSSDEGTCSYPGSRAILTSGTDYFSIGEFFFVLPSSW